MGCVYVFATVDIDDIYFFQSFTIWRFEQLMKNPLKYQPLVNQVELNYWNPQPNLIKVCVITPSLLKLSLMIY